MLNDRIVFIRAKTKNTTRRDQRPIVAMLNPQIDACIEKWGNKPVLNEGYIFPITDRWADTGTGTCQDPAGNQKHQ